MLRKILLTTLIALVGCVHAPASHPHHASQHTAHHHHDGYLPTKIHTPLGYHKGQYGHPMWMNTKPLKASQKQIQLWNSSGDEHLDKQQFQASIAAFNMAARAGDPYAQYMVGILFQNGLGTPVNAKLAGHWFKRAERSPKAPHARYQVAQHYLNANSPMHDLYQASFWLERAASTGSVAAARTLGDFYNNGHALKQNHLKALKWYGKAAAKGDAYAQYSIGVIYYNGLGVSKNEKQASIWFKKSAQAGFPEAQYMLGMLYHSGIGVDRDDTQAYAWWSLIKLDDRYSDLKAEMASLVKGMSPKEVANAITLANQYQLRFG